MAKKPQLTPEEKEALKAKYAAQNAEKEKKKEKKKEEFGEQNANYNMPIVEVRIPWEHTYKKNGVMITKEIDVNRPPWSDWERRALDEFMWQFHGKGDAPSRESCVGKFKAKLLRA